MMDESRLSFLGRAGLQRLREATVTVLGAGGGGSHVAQQLAHLAVGTVPLVDPDLLERSNVNRVVGVGYGDVGKRKAALLASRLSGLGACVISIRARAEHPSARAWIERSDVVVGAVDTFRVRDNIEKMCRSAFVPYLDIGVTIAVDDAQRVRAIGGQVAVSLPGGPCLWCLGILSDERLVADRVEYVSGMPEQQVISMNGLLASQAVNSALALIADFAPRFPPPQLVRYNGLMHELRRDDALAGARCPHYPVDDAGWRVILPGPIASA
jgi:molybdopterin-synthase adenylyltransferase